MAIIKKVYPERNITIVTFIIPKEVAEGIAECSIVGDFNNWNPIVHKMKKKAETGEFTLKIELPSNKTYEFKYLCSNGNWLVEDDSDGLVPNVHGSTNSLLKT